MIMLTPRFNTRALPSRSSIFDDFDQLMEGFFNESVMNNQLSLPYDVTEKDSHFLLSFDMPGVKEEDIKIEVLENKLTVSGERHDVFGDSEGHRYSSERRYGRFLRSFSLPESVEADKIEANFENGVLGVAIPKKEAVKGRTVQVHSGKSGIFKKLLGSKNETKIVKDVKAS